MRDQGLDLRGPFPLFGVGQVGPCHGQLPFRLVVRGQFGLRIEGEEALASLDLRAAADGERFQGARRGGGHVNKFALDITLHAVRIGTAATSRHGQHHQQAPQANAFFRPGALGARHGVHLFSPLRNSEQTVSVI